MINAKIVADSVNEFKHRISTLEVVGPRIILAEFNTHRLFSRNSASSRAIPFSKMVEAVETNPFIPIAWQKSHSGMQGNEYITDPFEIQRRVDAWLKARDAAVLQAKFLHEMGTTKQICNRLLEPFMYHKVLVTSTEFSNFFNLRAPLYKLKGLDKEYARSKKDWLEFMELSSAEHPDFYPKTDVDWLKINDSQAEIHIQAVAEAVWNAMNESAPKQLKAGEWHIPYGDLLDENQIKKVYGSNYEASDLSGTKTAREAITIKTAVARAARVSYTIVGQEKEHDYTKDIALYDSLLKSRHMSPFEHCAKAMGQDDLDKYILIEDDVTIPGVCRNFTGFIQLRALIEKVFK